jgi:hypothetical protein
VALARRDTGLERGGGFRQSAGLILAVLALAACAAPKFTYERRNATPAQLDHDLGQCKKEAFRPSRFAIWQSGRYDVEALNACMTRKGYAIRPEATR